MKVSYIIIKGKSKLSADIKINYSAQKKYKVGKSGTMRFIVFSNA